MAAQLLQLLLGHPGAEKRLLPPIPRCVM